MNDDAKRRLVGGIILAAILIVIAVLISDGDDNVTQEEPTALQMQLDAARGVSNEPETVQTLNLEMPPPREENMDTVQLDLPPPEPIGDPAAGNEYNNTATAASQDNGSEVIAQYEPPQPVSPIPRPTPKPQIQAPEPIAQPKPAPTPQPKPVVKPKPKPQPAAAPKPAPVRSPPPPQAVAGDWAVQVGSFSSPSNAERLRGKLQQRGYPAFVRRAQVNGVQVHRVRVGPFRTEVGAQQLAAKLSAELGQPVKVLHDK